MKARSCEKLSLQDLPFDILQRTLSDHNLFLIRTLSKGVKDRMDNFPETTIQLSLLGSQAASALFVTAFYGNLLTVIF